MKECEVPLEELMLGHSLLAQDKVDETQAKKRNLLIELKQLRQLEE